MEMKQERIRKIWKDKEVAENMKDKKINKISGRITKLRKFKEM